MGDSARVPSLQPSLSAWDYPSPQASRRLRPIIDMKMTVRPETMCLAMDTRQWYELGGAPFYLLPPWVQISPSGENVVTPLQRQFFYSQPQTQGFMPDAIGESWNFGVQDPFDSSIGVATAFPPTSCVNCDDDRGAIAPMTSTFDVRRSIDPLVPQRRYASTRRNRIARGFNPDLSIYFYTNSGEGFPMKDALKKDFKSLIGREDPMLRHCTAISLRFEFEGYESWTCQVKTRDSRKIPHPIPREKLAHEVAKKLVAFLNKRQATRGKPGEAVAHLNLFDIKDVVLVRLDHVSKASWQPQFKIVRNA